MDFTFKPFKNKNNNTQKSVTISQKTLNEVINLLSQVDCTCVWSENDNQYLKVNDIPKKLVDELNMLSKFAK